MVKLLIIADDFTGALDTGVQFAKRGIDTQVYTGTSVEKSTVSQTAQVLVVDSETRPLSRDKAYKTVKKSVRDAITLGVSTIFKKTDSALRGNVGGELSAVLDASGENQLYFIPAYPDVNRVTRNGMHYIDGQLLADSAFGKDPFEPVKCSYLPQLIREQTEYEVRQIKIEDPFPVEEKQGKTICLFDAETRQQMEQRIHEMKTYGKLTLLAGCAGLAACLPDVLELCETRPEKISRTKGLYVACGSLNPITKKQVEYAVSRGYARIHLTEEQKLIPGFYDTARGKMFLEELRTICEESEKVIVDTFDTDETCGTREYARRHNIDTEEIRYLISQCHGKIVKNLAENGLNYTILMTGGDTLMGFMKEIGCSQLHPVCEIGQGAVLSWLLWKGRKLQVISKSGGYGKKEMMIEIAQKVIKG